MKKELVIKKCSKCGALIRIINECDCSDCGILCCQEKMITLESNSVDAAFEKHIPTYEFDHDQLVVKVNHVMEEEHFIEWICFLTDEREEVVYLEPGMDAVVTFSNIEKGKLYAYCNKHGLWMKEVDN